MKHITYVALVIVFLGVATQADALVNMKTKVLERGEMEKSATTTGFRASSDTRVNTGMMRADAKAEVKTEMQEKKSEIATRVGDMRVKKVSMRLGATIERLTNITSRLNARIAKIKNAGGKTTEAEKYTAEAKMHLDEAQKSLTAFMSLPITSDTNASSTVKMADVIKKIRTAAQDVEKHIVAARQSLEKAVASIKTIEPKLKMATTTDTTITN